MSRSPYRIDGRPVDRVTTIVGDGIPKPALVNWAAEKTANYAVNHWDELLADDPTERLEKLKGARFEDLRRAAARGTDIHKLAMRLAAGEEVDVSEALTGHVDAYLRFVEEWQPRELLVETPVFNRTLQYAGTPDLIAELADGWTWLLDWKTAASGIWPENAVQLAAYRHAEFYLDHAGNEQPLPEIDFCGCVWLRADGYDLHKVDAGERTFRVFRYAQQIVLFAREPRERFIGESTPPPARKTAGAI